MAQSLVLSIDVCRRLGISPLRISIWLEFFSGRSWPKICPGIIFFEFFEKFETFPPKICAHSERYRNILAGIFEIRTFFRHHRLSIVTELGNDTYYIDVLLLFCCYFYCRFLSLQCYVYTITYSGAPQHQRGPKNVHRRGILRYTGPVSYTHLTLPTNREV